MAQHQSIGNSSIFSHPNSMPQPSTTSPQGNNSFPTRLPSINLPLPKFEGDEVIEWIYKCEWLFTLDNTPEYMKVTLAGSALEGRALVWHQAWRQPLIWSDYVKAIYNRFGWLYKGDPLSKLMKMKQLFTDEDYLKYLQLQLLPKEAKGVVVVDQFMNPCDTSVDLLNDGIYEKMGMGVNNQSKEDLMEDDTLQGDKMEDLQNEVQGYEVVIVTDHIDEAIDDVCDQMKTELMVEESLLENNAFGTDFLLAGEWFDLASYDAKQKYYTSQGLKQFYFLMLIGKEENTSLFPTFGGIGSKFHICGPQNALYNKKDAIPFSTFNMIDISSSIATFESKDDGAFIKGSHEWLREKNEVISSEMALSQEHDDKMTQYTNMCHDEPLTNEATFPYSQFLEGGFLVGGLAGNVHASMDAHINQKDLKMLFTQASKVEAYLNGEFFFLANDQANIIHSELVLGKLYMVNGLKILEKDMIVHPYESLYQPILRKTTAIMHKSTQFGGVRPFGVPLLIAGYEDISLQLFQVEPSGSYFSWEASNMVKNGFNVKTILEKSQEVHKIIMKIMLINWKWFYKDFIKWRDMLHPGKWSKEWKIAWMEIDCQATTILPNFNLRMNFSFTTCMENINGYKVLDKEMITQDNLDNAHYNLIHSIHIELVEMFTTSAPEAYHTNYTEYNLNLPSSARKICLELWSYFGTGDMRWG